QAEALAKKIASKGRIAIAAIMDSLREGRDVSLPEALRSEARNFGRTVQTEDKRIGVSAFIQKRPPIFVDR
ncbi:MAG: enoyl-CoA hydratase, partial [Cyanobacteria bacterium NC_groundwater_1444_Ag_S-0.65um_54_12]|nr:enoyl-CoA hydratase [Cyanobacteria bacterium NC_groundwater_1444_Ag_S-0.65um_54_12]